VLEENLTQARFLILYNVVVGNVLVFSANHVSETTLVSRFDLPFINLFQRVVTMGQRFARFDRGSSLLCADHKFPWFKGYF